MPLNKVITSAVLAASIAAGSLVPLSSAANAREWNHHSGGYGYSSGSRVEHFEAREHGRHNRWGEPRRNYRPQPQWHDADAGYRPRKKDHSGRNLAIGMFAAILGLAIASEASRAARYDDYRD